MKYHLRLKKRSEILIHTATSVNTENIMLSEKYLAITYEMSRICKCRDRKYISGFQDLDRDRKGE